MGQGCLSSKADTMALFPILVPTQGSFKVWIANYGLINHGSRTMDSPMPYSLVISELFSTASASVTIFNLKAKLYDERRAFGMMIDYGEL